MSKFIPYFVVLYFITHAVFAVPCSKNVSYHVFVACEWTNATHPNRHPSKYDPHYSPLCGTVHNENYTIWQVGGIASPGVSAIAERGDCFPLEHEIEECVKQGNCQEDTALYWRSDCSERNPSICTYYGVIDVSQAHSRFSWLAMLAPSPDWNFGQNSIELCHEGSWTKRFPQKGTDKLYAWDAGTDGGETYTSRNVALEELEAIRMFDANNDTNIFYNPELEIVLPICEAVITLEV